MQMTYYDDGFTYEQDCEHNLHNFANKGAYFEQLANAQHFEVFAEQGDQQNLSNIANKSVDIHEQMLGCHGKTRMHDPCHKYYPNDTNMREEFLQI